MGNTRQTVIGIVAALVIIVAGIFLYKQITASGSAAANTVLGHSPKEHDPNWSPDKNKPPGLTGVGGGG